MKHLRPRKVLLKTLLRQKDVKGNSPLHLACIRGSPDIGDLLALYDKEELVTRNEEGQTPFHLAARHSWAKLTKKSTFR